MENLRNRTKNHRSHNPFKGVSCDHRSGRWDAKITTGGVPRYLGQFDDPLSAALAYDLAAKRYFGDFAYLNFPQGGVSSD
jgi:hypothetical protein